MSSTRTDRGRHWGAPRTRGMVTGVGLVLLGAWGAIIPFVGPYFHYAYSPDKAWTWTSGRGYLEVLPGVVAVLAGLFLLMTTSRVWGAFAAMLGVCAGAWFVVGPLLAPLWNAHALGTPVGGTRTVAVEQIGIFYGLGAAIVLFAAAAVGRFSLATPHVLPDAAPAAAPTRAHAATPGDEPAGEAREREAWPAFLGSRPGGGTAGAPMNRPAHAFPAQPAASTFPPAPPAPEAPSASSESGETPDGTAAPAPADGANDTQRLPESQHSAPPELEEQNRSGWTTRRHRHMTPR